MYAVVIGRSAERELKTLTLEVGRRIGARLRVLAEDARPAQSKRLKGSSNFRLRVINYRVIYAVDDEAQVVTILAVGHRRDVYRGT